jgi:beta-lactamase class A
MIRRAALVLVLTAGVAAADEAAPKPRALTSKEAVVWSALEERLQASARGLDGVLGVAVKDLRTGTVLLLNADEVFPQASSIKLAILYELYRRADEGGIDLGDVVTPPLPRSGGSGVLKLLGPSLRLSWRDLAVLMMSLSDNAATNVLIDRLGMDKVNATLDGLGLPHTRLRRRMMDLPAALRGDENVSTPREMLALVEVLREGRGLKAESARDLRALAAVEKDSPFRTPLPETVTVLDKPGELEGVRCVTAVVELPRRPYTASIMTTFLRRDADGDAVIREVSALLFGVFDRLDRAADTGRIVSER